MRSRIKSTLPVGIIPPKRRPIQVACHCIANKLLNPHIMTTIEIDSIKERLEKIISTEIAPKLIALGGNQPEGFIEKLHLEGKLKSFAKDQYLEESRDFEDGKLIYLVNGIARTIYYSSESGKMMISRIWKKGEIIFDAKSFNNETPRRESVQALEEGEAVVFTFKSLKKFKTDFHQKMADFLLCHQGERDNYTLYYQELLKLSVDDKVGRYLRDNPGIEHRINKDIIALYLGISRSKFSSAYTKYKNK